MKKNKNFPRIYLNRIQFEIDCLHSDIRKNFLTEAIRDSLKSMKKSYQEFETVYRYNLFGYASHDFYINRIYNVYIDLCNHIDKVKSA